MARSNFQSFEQLKLEAENKSQRFLYVLTIIVVAMTIMQIGFVAVTKSGADSLLGAFGVVFVTLVNQTKENKQRWVFIALALSCSIGNLWLNYG